MSRIEEGLRKAINQIRLNIQNASRNRVHNYSFNIPEDKLKAAYALLDKEEGRRAMSVIFSDDHNFVVRYIPGRVHNETICNWAHAFDHALNAVVSTPPEPSPPGCAPIGATNFELGLREKQADGGVSPTSTGPPSVVLEVGDTESLTQLKIDARLWLEQIQEVRLVVLISIDPPLPTDPTIPRITVQLWKAGAPFHHAKQGLKKGKLLWSGKQSMRQPCTYYFPISLEPRCLLLMVTTTVWF